MLHVVVRSYSDGQKIITNGFTHLSFTVRSVNQPMDPVPYFVPYINKTRTILPGHTFYHDRTGAICRTGWAGLMIKEILLDAPSSSAKLVHTYIILVTVGVVSRFPVYVSS